MSTLKHTHPAAINSIVNSVELENYNLYSNLESSMSLFNQGRLRSLNSLTDKQNLTNTLKPLDTTKKISGKNSTTALYFDELLSTTQNNFFS